MVQRKKNFHSSRQGIFFFKQEVHVLIFSYFMAKTCGTYKKKPQQGASNKYPQHMFSWRNTNNIIWLSFLICSYGFSNVQELHARMRKG